MQNGQLWMSPEDVAEAEREGKLTVTSSEDVVVAGTAMEFDAWVDVTAPIVGNAVLGARPPTQQGFGQRLPGRC